MERGATGRLPSRGGRLQTRFSPGTAWSTPAAPFGYGQREHIFLSESLTGQRDAGTAPAAGTYVLRGGFWQRRTPAERRRAVPGRRAIRVAFGFRSPVPNPVRTQARISLDLPTRAKSAATRLRCLRDGRFGRWTSASSRFRRSATINSGTRIGRRGNAIARWRLGSCASRRMNIGALKRILAVLR